MNDYNRIERSIHYLEEHFSEQPSLKQVASHVGLSEYHFQRLFKRWAGISPKRFVQYLTAQYSSALLRNSNPVLDVSLDSGLSSSSRLHELMVNIFAMTPEQYRKYGDSLSIDYGWHSTPFGICLAAATDKGLCWLSFHDDESGLSELRSEWNAAQFSENPCRTESIIKQAFSSEDDTNGSVILHVKGTNLQIRVWEALLKIPAGEVVSYSQIARNVDHPKAVRAVASAVGRNAISYLIPCHRVIRNTGALGGYRWGLTRKKAILAWEAARIDCH